MTSGSLDRLAIATALGWGNGAQMVLAIGLAYLFGFSHRYLIARGRGHAVVQAHH